MKNAVCLQSYRRKKWLEKQFSSWGYYFLFVLALGFAALFVFSIFKIFMMLSGMP